MDEKQRMIEFLKENFACKKGFEFAVRECNSLMDCWNKARPDWLVWLATRKGVLTDREFNEFLLASAESVKHLMKDQRSLDALKVKRRWLDGEATDEELEGARGEAYAAVSTATSTAFYAADVAVYATSADAVAAAADAVAAAADAIASAAFSDAAADAAVYAAFSTAAAVASAAAAAERCKQADWLRKNTKPNL